MREWTPIGTTSTGENIIVNGCDFCSLGYGKIVKKNS
jgi:hypothetical protein